MTTITITNTGVHHHYYGKQADSESELKKQIEELKLDLEDKNNIIIQLRDYIDGQEESHQEQVERLKKRIEECSFEPEFENLNDPELLEDSDSDSDRETYESLSKKRIEVRVKKKGENTSSEVSEYDEINRQKALLDRDTYALDEYPDSVFDDLV